MVPMFWVSERGSHHLKLSWMSPFEINGVLTGYIISYRDGIKRFSLYTEWSEKIAQSLMYRHFATVCNRITRSSPKCSEKITVYQSMQNLYQLVKGSLINGRNRIQCHERRHPACEHDASEALTVEDRLLIQFANCNRLDC